MSYQKRRLYYKGMRLGAFGLPILGDGSKEDCKVVKRGRTKRAYHPSFTSPFKSTSLKNLMVMYDVSEGQKVERDWLRRQLLKFGYIMIQRSVWVGPSPLSKGFMDYIKVIGLKDDFKTFKLAKPYSGKSDTL